MSKKFDGKNAMDLFAEKVWAALEESEKNKQLAWVKPWRTIDCTWPRCDTYGDLECDWHENNGLSGNT